MKIKTITILLMIAAINLFAQLDRSIQPKPGPAPEIKLGDYESFELPNGLKVFVIENHKLPKVTFRLETVREPILEGKHKGYIDIAGQLLRTGTKTKTKDQIDEAVDFIGASLYTSGQSIYGSSLKRHFSSLMDIISDIILNADFKQEELDKIKKQTISGLAAAKEEPSSIASNLRKVLNYGKNHPYGEVTTEETVKSVTLDMCKNYYKDFFRPNISLLAIVGDITLDEAKDLVEKYLGSWEKKQVTGKKYKTPKAPIVRRVAISDRPASVQSVINITYPIDLKKGSDDVIKASLMSTILGGSFSARLMQNLREKHAYTYGAYARIASDRLVGNFIAQTTVRNPVTDSSVTEILNEMKRLRNEKVGDVELSRFKNFMAGGFARSLEKPQTIASFALNIEKYNLPKDYYKTYLKRLNKITADDIQTVSKKYLKPKNCNVIVVGNADEVAKSLKKFSPSGKIQYYDNYGNKYDPNVKKVPSDITAESIIEKYVKAIGGKEKLLAVKDKTTKLKGKMQGMDIKLTMSQKAPNKLYQEVDFGVGKQVIIFDGKKAKQEAMGQVQEITGDKLEDLKLQNNLYMVVDYKKYNVKYELKGIEKINDKDAYKILFTYPTGTKKTEYYDVNTGLKVREVNSIKTPQGNFTQTVDLGDYKPVNGLMVPYKMSQTVGANKLELEVTSVKINTGLKDSMFKVD